MSEGPDLGLATEIARELEQQGIIPLLIGALALAAHGFTRATTDVDFGIAVSPRRMRELADAMANPEREVELGEPDADDPLGGVISVHRRGSTPVQIVNFDNSPAGGFPALVRDAERSAVSVPELPGMLVSAEDLVLFKLYAGGTKSEFDIVHFFAHRTIDLDQLKARAKAYGLEKQLIAVLSRVGL